MARWLRKAKGDIQPWPWTENLARRKDMVEVSDHEARRMLGLADQAPADDEPGSGDALPTVEQILEVADKEELEQLGRAHGVELDKRRALKTMQGDLISRLDLTP